MRWRDHPLIKTFDVLHEAGLSFQDLQMFLVQKPLLLRETERKWLDKYNNWQTIRGIKNQINRGREFYIRPTGLSEDLKRFTDEYELLEKVEGERGVYRLVKLPVTQGRGLIRETQGKGNVIERVELVELFVQGRRRRRTELVGRLWKLQGLHRQKLSLEQEDRIDIAAEELRNTIADVGSNILVNRKNRPRGAHEVELQFMMVVDIPIPMMPQT